MPLNPPPPPDSRQSGAQMPLNSPPPPDSRQSGAQMPLNPPLLAGRPFTAAAPDRLPALTEPPAPYLRAGHNQRGVNP
jgi:hypothetical protein